MISIFGVVSMVVLLMCVAALALHFRVLGKRSAMDDAMAKFDELLRDRLESFIELVDVTERDIDVDAFYALCEFYMTAETRQIIKSWPKMFFVKWKCSKYKEKSVALKSR